MSPRQVIVIPVLPMFDDYASKVMSELKEA
jgi:threonyl-tRNA synthetase